MKLGIKDYNKNNSTITTEYVDDNLDTLLQGIELAKEDYPQSVVQDLDRIKARLDKEVVAINLWFDKYAKTVKGQMNNGVFNPNKVSVRSVAKKIAQESNIEERDYYISLQGERDGFNLLSSTNYLEEAKPKVLRRILVNMVERMLLLIAREQQKYFMEHDNYESKTREMHDFMWNWNMDFNNKIFNRQQVSDEELEKAWDFYLDLKTEMEDISKRVTAFRNVNQ